MSLEKAIYIASRVHLNQKDKSGKPYILHPLKVMDIVAKRYGDDEELMSIAVLHDTLEDTTENVLYLATELIEHFSPNVVNAVIAMTKRKGDTYEKYIEKLMENKSAIKVKMADIEHNSQITV